jgi:WD40 repeat protein
MESEPHQLNGLEHSKYWGFISYSHKDVAHARWLHRHIEKYRVPRRLIGRNTASGQIPKRLIPVFRDEDELAAAGSLPQQIRDALHSSRNLIVVCSPTAARSRWVEEEVRFYKSLGRADRVLCLVVDGTPNVSDGSEPKGDECFPAAVRYEVGDDGILTDRIADPLAADVRKSKGGAEPAKLRLLAGMIGVSFDELRQRERQRRVQRYALNVSLAAAIVCALAGTWYFQESRRAEERIREAILSYTNLGQRELAEGHLQRAAPVLAAAYQLGGTETRLRLLQAWSMETMRMRAAPLLSGNARAPTLVLDTRGERLIAVGTAVPKLWNATTGQLISQLTGHDGRVNAAAFTADGRQVITAGDDHTLRFWDADSGKLLESHSSHDTVLTHLAMSANGDWIVTHGADDTNLLWRVKDRRGTRLTGADYQMRPPGQFDRDGRRFAAISKEGQSLLVWDVERPTAPIAVRLELPIESFTFTPTGESLVIGDTTGVVRAFRSDNGAAVEQTTHPAFNADTGAPVHLSFLDDQRLLLIGRRGVVQIWDFAQARKLHEYSTGLDQVDVLNVRDANLVLASHGAEPRASVWQLGDGNNLAIDLDGVALTSAAIDPRRGKLFTAGGGELAVWNLSQRPANHVLQTRGERVNGLDISPDGKWVVTGDSGGALLIWNAQTGTAVNELPRQDSEVSSARFFANGQRLLTVGEKSFRIWDAGDYRIIKHLPPELQISPVEPSPAYPPTVALALQNQIILWAEGSDAVGLKAGFDHLAVMAFSRDGRKLAAGHEDGLIEIWDVPHPVPIASTWSFSGAVRSLEFSPDGQYLAAAGVDPYAVIISVRDFAKVTRIVGHVGPIAMVRFSPDGRHLATAGSDKTAKIWDVQSGSLISSLEAHSSGVDHLAFSPDGAILATGGADSYVHVWDTQTGRLIRSLHHAGAIVSLKFSPDGKALVVGVNGGGSAQIWDLQPERRSPTSIAEQVARGSPWHFVNDALVRGGGVGADTARSAPDGAAGAEAPEKIVTSFIHALEQGSPEQLRLLLSDDQNAGTVITSLRTDSGRSLRSYYNDFFAQARIENTMLRRDGLGARTDLRAKTGDIAVWTIFERQQWKILNIGARRHED